MATNQGTYSEHSYLKSRARSQFISATLSIAMVLLLLGLFATLAVFGRKFIAYAKESMQMKVFLNEGVKVEDRNALLDELKLKPYTAKATYISKEEASKILLARTGEDVKKLMGGINPLLASINVKLKARYVDADSFTIIQKALMNKAIVAEVNYPVNMITTLNRNASYLFIISLIFIIIAVIITFYLVVNTIRLSIYAQRLSIRTMQLIGATESFIRAPFLRSGIWQGFLGGIIAVALLCSLLFFVNLRLASVSLSTNFVISPEFFVLMLGIVLFGAFLGYVGSYLAVNKYLNRSLEELYR
ncbi:MAG: cell division protein FtsX [Bacteroidia bacterium]